MNDISGMTEQLMSNMLATRQQAAPTTQQEAMQAMLKGMNADDIDGILLNLRKKFLEMMLEAERTGHLRYPRYENRPENEENRRNDHTSKEVRTSADR